MKHLLLLRHAKSVVAEPGQADRDRPLADCGRRDAGLMAATIARDYPPDVILCSSAKRTRETLAAILPHLPAEPMVKITDVLYQPPTGEYLTAIGALGGIAKQLLVVGHNPTIHMTALALVGSGDKALRAKLTAKMPTCGLAVIAFESPNWSEIASETGKLVAFVRPRDLGATGSDD